MKNRPTSELFGDGRYDPPAAIEKISLPAEIRTRACGVYNCRRLDQLDYRELNGRDSGAAKITSSLLGFLHKKIGQRPELYPTATSMTRPPSSKKSLHVRNRTCACSYGDRTRENQKRAILPLDYVERKSKAKIKYEPTTLPLSYIAAKTDSDGKFRSYGLWVDQE